MFLAAIMFALAVLISVSTANAESPAGLKYEVSWLGNSFSGADGRWVQNFFIHIAVQPDGTVNTWSHWDESGRRFGIYKDGDVIGNEDVGANSLECKDLLGRKWVLEVKYNEPDQQEFEFVPVRITCDGQPIEFPGLHQPTAIAIDNQGRLMIADSLTSPRQQVLFYDVENLKDPKLVREFGARGGIGSGVPGIVTNDKLWGVRGIGMDRAGNLYVAMSEMGSVLRKYDPKDKLVWEVRDDFFVDVVSADPKSDAVDIWGIQEHYKMDWSKPPGKESTLVGYSLDRHRFPHDPRGLPHVKQQGEHGMTSPQVVYLNGQRFMYVGGMFGSNFINIFRYEGEMAIPSGMIQQRERHGLYRSEQKWPPHYPEGRFIWRDLNGDGQYDANEYQADTSPVEPGPFWVDKKGNIWMAYGFFRYDFQGLDQHGNPIYSSEKITRLEKPNGVNKVARVIYLDETDTLIVAEEGEYMRHIDRVHICRNYLAGNRQTVSFLPGAGENAGCVAAVGEYVFTGGWQERGKIWVNRMSDGACVGTFVPGATVGGIQETGWIDILTGITAHRRENGEYLVFVEEDAKGKVLIYRWKPQSVSKDERD